VNTLPVTDYRNFRRFRPTTIARGPRFRSELRHRIAFEVER
jgi:hypothetical protein